MKQKANFRNLLKPPLSLILASSVLGTMCLLNSCFLKQDRTTVVYGTITDQNKQPVDSILVVIQGVKWFKYESVKQVYSDSNGCYELIAEIPKKYASAEIIIPFNPLHNSKFEKLYKGFRLFKNEVETNNCCSVTIGERTNYDFQLIPN